MIRLLSFHRVGLLAALLFVGIGSALHAQTVANSDVANSNSTLGRHVLTMYGVLHQESGDSPLNFPSPEVILGHRLLVKMGTRNATTQIANDNPFVTAGKINSHVDDGAATTHRYFITGLGTLGGTESFAFALNGSGQVVGSSRTTGDVSTHSFLYSKDLMTDLFPLNSQNIQTAGPTGINNSGQIASGLIVGGVYSPAILDSATGVLTLLGSLGGVTSFGFNGVATSVNNLRDAVGYSYIDAIHRHAFLYSNGTMTDIDSFGGDSVAFAINDEGVIVGLASPANNGPATAFVYSQGVTTKIFPLRTESDARGVNNRGQVVGEFLTADQSAFHGFLYSDGVITDLGSPNSPETIAFAINDQQQVAGTTYVPIETTCSGVPCVQYAPHAFFYEGGNMTDLNALIPSASGWVLSWGMDINNNGQIAGYGVLNDKFLAFLLTPATSNEQCKDDGWQVFGFKNQGECIRFVSTGK
jgi:probable HAF family extracellular repeat protein